MRVLHPMHGHRCKNTPPETARDLFRRDGSSAGHRERVCHTNTSFVVVSREAPADEFHHHVRAILDEELDGHSFGCEDELQRMVSHVGSFQGQAFAPWEGALDACPTPTHAPTRITRSLRSVS